MPKKRHKPEEIVAKLRQVDVMVSQGQSVADAVRAIGVTEVTYYRWRQEFGGLKSDQVKRLKDLEAENARPVRAGGSATPTSTAARAGGKAITPLAFQPGHSMGAGQKRPSCSQRRSERSIRPCGW
jgi:putative transposase